MQNVSLWHNSDNTMCLLSVLVKQLYLPAERVIPPQVRVTQITKKDNYTRLDIASQIRSITARWRPAVQAVKMQE